MSGRADGKQNRFSRICAGIVLALTLAFMAFLLPMSLIRTTGMSTGGVGGEIVSFNYDNASEFTQCKMISNELFENYCPERLK